MPYIGNSPGTGTRNRFIYTATASQTTFSGADDNGKTLKYADSDYVDVYLNGICLVPVTDYTSTSKTSIVLTQAASLNDTLEVVAYDIATISDTVSKADGGNFEAGVNIDGDVGIGTTSPLRSLHVSGAGDTGLMLQTTNATDDKEIWEIQSAADASSEANLIFRTRVNAGTGGTEALRITNDGKVGIGTSSPTHELVLFGTGAGNATMQIEGEGGADPQINFLTNNTTHWSVGVDDSRFDTFKINNHSAVGTTNEYLCVDTSGKVGINTDSMSNNLTIEGTGYTLFGMKRNTGVTTGTGELGIHMETNSQTTVSFDDEGSFVFGQAGTPSTQAGFTELVRIDNDGRLRLLTGTSNPGSSQSGVRISGVNGDNFWQSANSGTSGYDQLVFINANGTVGRITTSGSGTTYSTSSDYRLKENVTDITDGITRVKQLSPKRFNFIADSNTIVDGFLAHEAQAVVPEAVTGAKDGMEDEEYEVSAATGDIYTPATEEAEEVIHSSNVEQPETLEEGQRWRETTAAEMGTRTVPKMQGIDQAKLVPLLTAALQEAIAKIETLETKVAALEAG